MPATKCNTSNYDVNRHMPPINPDPEASDKLDITSTLVLNDNTTKTNSVFQPIQNNEVCFNNMGLISPHPTESVKGKSMQNNHNSDLNNLPNEKENKSFKINPRIEDFQQSLKALVKNSQSENITNRLFCKICHEKFTKRCEYDQHYRDLHPGVDIVYVCSICMLQEPDFNKFRNHYYRHFNKGGLRCSLCPNYRFTQKEHFLDHTKALHKGMSVQEPDLISVCRSSPSNHDTSDKSCNLFCSMCKKEFTQKDEYENHFKIKHDTHYILYECSPCHRFFKSFKNYQKHKCSQITLNNQVLEPTNEQETTQRETVIQKSNEACNPVKESDNSSTTSFNSLMEALIIDHQNVQKKSSVDDQASGIGNVKDPTLACLTEEMGDWDLLFNDLNHTENTIINELLEENYDIPLNANHNCNLFEEIRFDLNDETTSVDKDSEIKSIEPADRSDVINDSTVDHLTTNSNKSCNEVEKPHDQITNFKAKPKETFLMCYVCKEDFVSKDGLIKHFDDTHQSWLVMYKCRYCKFDDQDFVHYNRHLCHLHNFSKRVTQMCPLCKKKFKTISELSKHAELHKPEVKVGWAQQGFLCKLCNKKIPTKDLYCFHFKEKHSAFKLFYTCAWCRKQFINYDSFRSHSNSHFMSGKYTCSHCGKGFPKLFKLTAHKKLLHKVKDGSNLMHPYQPRPSSQASSSYESNLSDLDTNDGSSETSQLTDRFENSSVNENESEVFVQSKNDFVNQERISCTNKFDSLCITEDSADYSVLSDFDTFSTMNSVDSSNLYDFDEYNFQRRSTNLNVDYMNSPESGIDCMNSPLSDFLSSPDYMNDCLDSPESAVYCRSPICKKVDKQLLKHWEINSKGQETMSRTLVNLKHTELQPMENYQKYLNKHLISPSIDGEFKSLDQLSSNQTSHIQQAVKCELISPSKNLKRKKTKSQSNREDGLQYEGSMDNEKSKTCRSSEETIETNCFSTELLSKYNLEDCIQSVINTSEDFEHSVIYTEYNKGIKCNYNDILRYNKSLDTQFTSTTDRHHHTADQNQQWLNNDKQLQFNQTTLDCSSPDDIHNNDLQQYPEEHFHTSSLGNEENRLEGNTATALPSLQYENNEDLTNLIVFKNKKTEDLIASRRKNYLISDQSIIMESFKHDHRKQSKAINETSASCDNQTTPPQPDESSQIMLIATQATQNEEQFYKQSSYEELALQPLSVIQNPIAFNGNNAVFTVLQHQKERIECVLPVIAINIIVSTSPAVSNTNDFPHKDNTLLRSTSLPEHTPQHSLNSMKHLQNSLRGFRRKPKLFCLTDQ